MTSHVLITGGAGFIGSHVADELLRQGVRVRALDSLVPQVHGPDRRRPAYLDPEVELIVGDVRDRDAVKSALRGVDAVVHFASAVGVGQSMYKIAEYTSINNVGTAVLLEELAEKPVSRLLVASSMSVYGEGLYRTASGAVVPGASRPLEQLRRGDWEVRSEAGEALVPIPTPESKPPSLESVYALSKYDQERLCLMIGRAYQIPTVALRFFNVYGRRQALSNPYTGVLAIFAARLLNDRPPVIFEDGLQRRDLVSVTDVARACVRALGADAAVGQVLNIGSGRSYSVREVAERVREVMGKSGIEPEIVGKSRLGDVRHCFADISAAQQKIGYAPRVSLEEGLRDLADWLEGQVAKDAVAQARAELESRGLTV
ncbi:NAD-dependent epimerase/dehydratase family protein [Sorangium sp. So ce726]|uniref:NAD-dependent epimerase/dehydratase family protein n=1 Tax=Sorangium sp. So ce726 TaxID=3133319 RepID=UPI003F612783